MSDLGDIGAFLKGGSLSDLSWLDIDEKEYRKEDILPRQNLDTQPDLTALWAREGESPVAHLVPNKQPVESFPGAGTPHTMGDLSQAHGPLRNQALEIRKVARLALMQTSDSSRWRDTLVKRFSKEALREHREVLASVVAERGLLGNLYIDAADFPGCHNSPKVATGFVRKFASEAKYVVAKTACGDCSHCQSTVAGGSNCAVFHKEIQLQVPYSEQLAQAVEQSQEAKGVEVEASSAVPKERIRRAFLASAPGRVSTYQGQGEGKIPEVKPLAPMDRDQQLVQASDLVKNRRASTQKVVNASPIADFLRREMVKGLSEQELHKSLRLAFAPEVLKQTFPQWSGLLKEAGLYGVIYSTQDSFDDCHVGADFFAKHNPGVRAIVGGTKCSSCIYNKTRCMLYGKQLVKNAEELYTPETVAAVLLEHQTAGRLQPWDGKTASDWSSEPREALKSIHKVATQPSLPAATPMRLDNMEAFRGNQTEHVSSSQTRRAIVKQAAQYMNEGLYGRDLLRLLKSRFEPRDLVAAADDLRTILAEQGLQGIYFIDPTVYDDYGRGCEKAASLHRSRKVPYVKVAAKCSSCVHHRKVGVCSKLNKALVTEPPYADKTAQQREILATGASTDNPVEGLVNNGMSVMAEYQMQHGARDLEVNDVPARLPVEMQTGKINL